MKKTAQKRSGFVMLLIQAIAYVLICCVGIAILIYAISLEIQEQYALIIVGSILMSIGFVLAILQFICAFNCKYKDANVTSIVLSSIFIALNLCLSFGNGMVFGFICASLGVFGIIGGSQALKKGKFELPSGSALRTFQAFFWLLASIAFIVTGTVIWIFEATNSYDIMFCLIFIGMGVLFLIFTIIQFIAARKGKKSLKANTASIALNAIFSVFIVGIPGVVGGVQGRKFLKAYPDGIVIEENPEEEIIETNAEKNFVAQRQTTVNTTTTSDILDTVDYSIPNDCGKILSLTSGSNIVEFIRSAMSGIEVDVNSIGIFDADGDELEAQIGGYKIEQKGDTNRLYIILNAMSGENEILCLFYVVQLVNGEYALAEERDEAMKEKIQNWLSSTVNSDEPAKSGGKKFLLGLGKFFLGFFKVIGNIGKDVLKLFGSLFGDTAFAKAFKRGYNSEDEEVQTYTVTNSMGCEQTVYTRDGKYFYDISGEFVGESHDGGKTIIWK